MRAYHQSEISHANHAITMLLAIAAAAGAVALAILFPQVTPNHVHEVAWGLWIVVSVFAVTIALTTHIKISGDHEVYARFGDEYVRTCVLLNFYALDAAKNEIGLKKNRNIGQGKGYRKTQAIIWGVAGVLVVFTFLFALLVCLLL